METTHTVTQNGTEAHEGVTVAEPRPSRLAWPRTGRPTPDTAPGGRQALLGWVCWELKRVTDSPAVISAIGRVAMLLDPGATWLLMICQDRARVFVAIEPIKADGFYARSEAEWARIGELFLEAVHGAGACDASCDFGGWVEGRLPSSPRLSGEAAGSPSGIWSIVREREGGPSRAVRARLNTPLRWVDQPPASCRTQVTDGGAPLKLGLFRDVANREHELVLYPRRGVVIDHHWKPGEPGYCLAGRSELEMEGVLEEEELACRLPDLIISHFGLIAERGGWLLSSHLGLVRPAALRQGLRLLEEVAPLAGGLERARVVLRRWWKVVLATVLRKLPGPDGEGTELDAARSAVSAVLLDVLAAPLEEDEDESASSVLEWLGTAALGPSWREVPDQAIWARQIGSRLEIACAEAVFLEGDRARLLARLGPEGALRVDLMLSDFWRLLTDHARPPAVAPFRARAKVWYVSDAWLRSRLPADRAEWPGFVEATAKTAVTKAIAQLDNVGWKAAPSCQITQPASGRAR